MGILCPGGIQRREAFRGSFPHGDDQRPCVRKVVGTRIQRGGPVHGNDGGRMSVSRMGLYKVEIYGVTSLGLASNGM